MLLWCSNTRLAVCMRAMQEQSLAERDIDNVARHRPRLHVAAEKKRV